MRDKNFMEKLADASAPLRKQRRVHWYAQWVCWFDRLLWMGLWFAIGTVATLFVAYLLYKLNS